MAITPLALAFAAAGAGLSAAAAIQKNEAVKSSFAAQQQQIKKSADNEKIQLARSLQQRISMIRASAGGRGIAVNSGSAGAAQTSTQLIGQENSRIISENARNAINAAVAKANAQFQSPLLAGIEGGLAGLTAGAALFPAAGAAAAGTAAAATAEAAAAGTEAGTTAATAAGTTAAATASTSGFFPSFPFFPFPGFPPP